MKNKIQKALLIIKGLWNPPMAEKRRVKVMCKFLWWQLVEKHFAGNGIVKIG